MRIVHLVTGSWVLGLAAIACSATGGDAPGAAAGAAGASGGGFGARGGTGGVATGVWSCDPDYRQDDVCDCGCNAPDPACDGAGCSEPGCSAPACDYCHDASGEEIACVSGGSVATGGSATGTGGGSVATGGTGGGTPPVEGTVIRVQSVSVTGCAAQATYDLASGSSGFVANDEGSSVSGVTLDGATMSAPLAAPGQWAQIQLPFSPPADMSGCSLQAQVSLTDAGSCSAPLGVVLWFFDGTQLIQPWYEGQPVADPISSGTITFTPQGVDLSATGAIGINVYCGSP